MQEYIHTLIPATFMLQHQNLKFSYHTFAIQICLVGPICTSERPVYDNEDEKWFKKKKTPTAKLSYKSFWARQASAQKLLIDFSSRNYQQFCICVSVISSFITFSKDKSHLTALLFSCAHIFLPFNKAELKLEIGRHFLSNCHLTVWCWANNRDKIIEMF